MPSKLLPLRKNETGSTAMVDCAGGEVSVYRKCAYCIHCLAIQARGVGVPNPYAQIYQDLRRGRIDDQGMLTAAVRFNVLVRDGDTIECGDCEGEGYHPRSRV